MANVAPTPANVPQAAFNHARAEAFAADQLTALNHATQCLMISVGHRTGLFDTMRAMPPASSSEIAGSAGLHERYVREWLAAMTAARIIDFDPATDRFSLPAEHAAYLTRAAAADNMAVFSQYVAVLGGVEDDIVECFRRGGGVPYSRFRRFHEVVAEDSGQSVLSSLESHILPLVPGLIDRLAAGIRMLDAGCGRGRILNRLASLYPRSRFVGMDLSSEAIDWARAEATRAGLDNLEFLATDLSDFNTTAQPEAFDFVTTFDAIHDQGQPLNVLKGIHRTLRPDGAYLMQDINGTGHLERDLDHPVATFLYSVSCMHCMTVSLAQGGEGLGTMWGGEDPRVSASGRLSLRDDAPARARHHEQLVRGDEVTATTTKTLWSAVLLLTAQPTTPSAHGVSESDARLVERVVEGRSLEDNLLGETPDRKVLIYLPADHFNKNAGRGT